MKRNSPGGGSVVGLYITYQRREDAARAIAAVDGTHFPGGSRDVMRASYGTTKYCMAFLRGVTCSDHSCMNLHEWGDEKDCFTKEDLTTLYNHLILIFLYLTLILHFSQKTYNEGHREPHSATTQKSRRRWQVFFLSQGHSVYLPN